MGNKSRIREDMIPKPSNKKQLGSFTSRPAALLFGTEWQTVAPSPSRIMRRDYLPGNLSEKLLELDQTFLLGSIGDTAVPFFECASDTLAAEIVPLNRVKRWGALENCSNFGGLRAIVVNREVNPSLVWGKSAEIPPMLEDILSSGHMYVLRNFCVYWIGTLLVLCPEANI